jgi:hypothetical protein
MPHACNLPDCYRYIIDCVAAKKNRLERDRNFFVERIGKFFVEFLKASATVSNLDL